MKKNILVFGGWVLFGYCILSLGFSAYGWRVTKELEQEINEKKAAVATAPKDPSAHFDLAITLAYTNHIQDGWT